MHKKLHCWISLIRIFPYMDRIVSVFTHICVDCVDSVDCVDCADSIWVDCVDSVDCADCADSIWVDCAEQSLYTKRKTC